MYSGRHGIRVYVCYVFAAQTRSTPHKKGAKRANASGKAYQVRLIVPDQYRPVENAVYRCRFKRIETDKKTLISIEVRNMENRV